MKLLLALFLLLAVPAHAEFTNQEKAQIATQLDAMHAAARSMQYVAQHVRTHTDQASDAGAYAGRVVLQRSRHFKAMLGLADFPALGLRADTIAGAKALFASVDYLSPRTKLLQMQAACASGCVNLGTALIVLDDAIRLYNNFDTTLPYLEPRLAVNMSIPGSTRLITGTAGPHGDYLFFLKKLDNVNDNIGSAILRTFEAYVQQPTFGRTLFDHTAHGKLVFKHSNWALGLVVGAETAEVRAHVDQMEAGGTTTRGREFFQMTLAMELALNREDNGADVFDVNGRVMVRGNSYEMGRMCQESARILRQDVNLPAYVRKIATSFERVCDAWTNMDNGTYGGALALKHFQVFPPNPPSNPTNPPTVCPTYLPVLDVLSDSIRARCVAQP